MNRLATVLCTSILLAACGPPPPPPAPPVPTPAPKPPPPKATAAPTAAPAPKPKSKAPRLPGAETLPAQELPELFKDVGKLHADKSWADAGAALAKKRELMKKGKLSLDEKMLFFALLGRTEAMNKEPDKAEKAYRRVLSLWTNPRKHANAIKGMEKDAAKGEARVKVAVDAFGEALFFTAEKKRLRAETKELAAYDGDADPKNVSSYLKKKVTLWIQRRGIAVDKAEEAYLQITKLTPEPPARWVSAAHARIAAMRGMMVEELRKVKPPTAWNKEGKSTYVDPKKGKEPLDFKQLHEDHAAQMKALFDPVMAKAKTAYEACKDSSATAGDKDDFKQSCLDWLEAHAGD